MLEILTLVAQLGGYINHPNRKDPPGPQTIWLGLQRMYDLALAWNTFGPGAATAPRGENLCITTRAMPWAGILPPFRRFLVGAIIRGTAWPYVGFLSWLASRPLSRSLVTLTRSTSQAVNALPHLHFGLVWNVSFLAAGRIAVGGRRSLEQVQRDMCLALVMDFVP